MSKKHGLTQVLLYFLALIFMAVTGCGDGADDFKIPKYHDTDEDKCSISGRLTYNGAALPGISVQLSGYSTAYATTDENGEYEFDDLDGDQAYVVSPSSAVFLFTPESTGVEPGGSSVTNVNFEAMDCCGDDESEEDTPEDSPET